jgi:mannosylfructose-phosphate synthase
MSEKIMNKIRNICMVSTHGYFDPVPQLGRTDTGGQVVYVLELAKAFTRIGITVDIYTRWFDYTKRQIDPVADCPDVQVIRIPAGPEEFIPKEEIYDVLPALAKNMITFINDKQLKYDLFHGHYVDAGIVTIDVVEAFDAPAFFTTHSIGAWKRETMGGNPDEMEKKYKFKHRISEELRIFKTVTALTVTTELQREKIKQLYGYTSDNIAVISPGVNIHTFQPPSPGEEKIDTSLPEPYIFCLSRIDANKGHDFLLKAFDIVRKKIPDINLVIGGGSPKPQETEREVLATIQKIIVERRMQKKVHCVGYIPDERLVASYQNARLFALPSIFEPFGMTALEAMACNVPVIASKYGGIRNVIQSGENGLLVDPKNSEEFARAMFMILNDRKMATRLGQAGRTTIHKHFSWEAIAEKHIAFYKKFIDL